MSGRPNRRSSSPLLPFNDAADSSCNDSPDQRPPTAFISYSHEGLEHGKRALNLATRLRTEGVDCEIDSFETSPPEGWPLWMQRQAEKSDFVIAVCTETYMRRFVGSETSGKGKGATWEGRLIQQDLYDAGENRRIIPIVFDQADVDYIPLALKSATYYDLSTDSGYHDLHRALTKQPQVERQPLGPIPRRLPNLDPDESGVIALLHLCPDPLPPEVVACGFGREVTKIATTIQRLVQIGVLKTEEDAVRLETRTVAGIPVPSDNVVGSTP